MEASNPEQYPDTHHDTYSKTLFGFWLYLMTDFILFGSLFAIWAVLRNNTFGGPGSQDLFSLSWNLFQTFLLMFASFTGGVGGAYAHRNEKNRCLSWFLITAALGIGFLIMQTMEFARLIEAGHTWKGSGFLSAFFTLVGTFWAHIIFAVLFTFIIIWPVWRGDRDIGLRNLTRLTCLRQFWQFLFVVWIFIFTIVYLLGAK